MQIDALIAGATAIAGGLAGWWTAWEQGRRQDRKDRVDAVVQIDTQQFRLIDQLSERIKLLEQRVDDHGKQQLECERRDAENKVHITLLEREIERMKAKLAGVEAVP